jgi:hypothetical protein
LRSKMSQAGGSRYFPSVANLPYANPGHRRRRLYRVPSG